MMIRRKAHRAVRLDHEPEDYPLLRPIRHVIISPMHEGNIQDVDIDVQDEAQLSSRIGIDGI